LQTFKRARLSEREACAMLQFCIQFHIYYNFIIFKLCSTTEQMPALVWIYASSFYCGDQWDSFHICMYRFAQQVHTKNLCIHAPT
jgi:hypothetical protein